MKKPIVPKKYLKVYDETARNRTLKVLFRYPEKEFSLSELAKEAGVAKANIGRIIAEFQSVELIKIEKLSKIWRIKANQQNWCFIRTKIVYNLNSVYQSGLVEFLKDAFNNPKSIILFGSFRWGEDISSSDIDVAVESDDFKDYTVTRLVDPEIIEAEKMIGRSIRIHKFNRDNVDTNVFNNIANGIILLGFLEVKK